MTDTEGTLDLPSSKAMAIKQKGGKWHPRAVRLRVLRTAMFGENSSSFARRLGIAVNRMNNFENGYPIPVEVANRIRAAVPGLTLDWIYHGDERALPFDMLTKLRSQAKADGASG